MKATVGGGAAVQPIIEIAINPSSRNLRMAKLQKEAGCAATKIKPLITLRALIRNGACNRQSYPCHPCDQWSEFLPQNKKSEDISERRLPQIMPGHPILSASIGIHLRQLILRQRE
jgi:hypothetical protein